MARISQVKKIAAFYRNNVFIFIAKTQILFHQKLLFIANSQKIVFAINKLLRSCKICDKSFFYRKSCITCDKLNF